MVWQITGNASGLTDYGMGTFQDASQNGLTIGYDTTNNWSWLYSRSVNIVGRPININDLLYVQWNGNVGIGTSGPRDKLDIFATGTYSNIEFIGHPLEISTGGSSGDYTLFIGADKTNQLSYIQSAEVNIKKATLALNPQGGNVGIGTVKPNSTLTVQGDVSVTGDVILTGADCAEEFDVTEAMNIEPGTVVVIAQDGSLQQSQQAYDKRVAGVISGAGDYQPGLVLDRKQARQNRAPVALVGKVYCKVDAQYAPIEVGDLLTTSPTPGHAMKATDRLQAFGTVIGKALRPFGTGQGLIPILIALQ